MGQIEIEKVTDNEWAKFHTLIPPFTLQGRIEISPPQNAWIVRSHAERPCMLRINSPSTPLITISVRAGFPVTASVEDCIYRPVNYGIEENFALRAIYVSNPAPESVHLAFWVKASQTITPKDLEAPAPESPGPSEIRPDTPRSACPPNE